MDTIRTGREVMIEYTNWRGVRRERIIQPLRIWFGTSLYHKGTDWFLHAIDIEKEDVRDFRMADIHSFILLE